MTSVQKVPLFVLACICVFIGFALGHFYPQIVSQPSEKANSDESIIVLKDDLSIGAKEFQLVSILTKSQKTQQIVLQNIQNSQDRVALDEIDFDQTIASTLVSPNRRQFILSYGGGNSINFKLLGVQLTEDMKNISAVSKPSFFQFSGDARMFHTIITFVDDDHVAGRTLQLDGSSGSPRYWTAPITNINKKTYISL